MHSETCYWEKKDAVLHGCLVSSCRGFLEILCSDEKMLQPCKTALNYYNWKETFLLSIGLLQKRATIYNCQVLKLKLWGVKPGSSLPPPPRPLSRSSSLCKTLDNSFNSPAFLQGTWRALPLVCDRYLSLCGHYCLLIKLASSELMLHVESILSHKIYLFVCPLPYK